MEISPGPCDRRDVVNTWALSSVDELVAGFLDACAQDYECDDAVTGGLVGRTDYGSFGNAVATDQGADSTSEFEARCPETF